MAFSNSKSNLLIKISIPFLLLLQLYYVNSQQESSPSLSSSETIGFSFSTFEKDNPNVIVVDNASISGGVLRLTKTDQLGKPLPRGVGRAVHVTPVHLWDKKTGVLADFSCGFTFVVNTNGSSLHGDGFAFFIASFNNVEFPKNSSGGYLGLFNPATALDPTKNQIVAIEFDSFTNEWDPAYGQPSQFPHLGIDVDSVESVATTFWPIDFEPGNAIAHASINYNSESKKLSVFLDYPGRNTNATVSYFVDLRSVLSEWVRVGFSAATGDLVETHDILNWSFEAAL